MDYKRMWEGLKIVLQTLARMANVQDGFAEQMLKLMAKIEDDESKKKER